MISGSDSVNADSSVIYVHHRLLVSVATRPHLAVGAEFFSLACVLRTDLETDPIGFYMPQDFGMTAVGLMSQESVPPAEIPFARCFPVWFISRFSFSPLPIILFQP